ncbi:hypothetical protein D3OALGA1CA_4861 [Olavius algarvensis associated proteobacterium Delta 3]|nr:hypothetical protein D3OALGA1CA_4861 [Olavius algarvensis associated proteobacterium Delta 3]
MTYLFYAIISLGILVWQTAVQPQMPFFRWMYDLLVSITIYLGLYRPAREGLPVVFCLGFAMDNFSAAPFGLYITSYLWIFAGIKWLMTFLDVRGSLLLYFVTAAGILIQNFLSLATAVAGGSDLPLPEGFTRGLFIQFCWALVIGPLFLMAFRWIHEHFEKWWMDRMAEKNGYPTLGKSK